MQSLYEGGLMFLAHIAHPHTPHPSPVFSDLMFVVLVALTVACICVIAFKNPAKPA